MQCARPFWMTSSTFRPIVVWLVFAIVAIRSLSGAICIEGEIERAERVAHQCVQFDLECSASSEHGIDLGDDSCYQVFWGYHLLAHGAWDGVLEPRVTLAMNPVLHALMRTLVLQVFPAEIFHPPKH